VGAPADSTSTRIVLITGVTRGLGRALAERLMELGRTIWGCGRSEAGIRALTEQFPGPHRFDVVDVADERAVAAWGASLLAGGAAPDLVLNNAALINASQPLWEVPAAEFSAVVDVNVKGVYHIIREFVPAMSKRGRGVIVNFSSGWGRSASAEVAPYCATKWAIEGLTQALAQELPRGLAAVAVNPGIIDTEMLRSCFGGGAAHYDGPAAWSRRAVPFLLSLSAADNGRSLDVPE
jgi:NAD(P)-dependent dehydrogenase (short-subunit alcohol dehydrogenase family)